MSCTFRTRWGAPFLFALSTLVATSTTPAWALSPADTQGAIGTRATLTATLPLTLQGAYHAAIALQPWTLARADRDNEQRLRESLADSWLADSPTLATSVKTGNRDGLREFEAEISTSIATPSRRALQVATAQSESAAYRAGTGLQSLKLAGEVRDAYWAVLLAQTEQALAEDELRRSEQLAIDTGRRAQAGDAARVDTLQAQAVVQNARGTLLEVEQRLTVARQALRALIGEAALGALADIAEVQASNRLTAVGDHPALRATWQAVQLARARLNEASGVVSATPTLSLTLTNERSNSSATGTTARIGIAIPFGGAQRAASRIALANAELTEAQANAQLLKRQIETEASSAQAAVLIAERRVDTLAERARLANEVADLYVRAYRLGELDLPTRLRTESERTAANLAMNRARIELKHAQSSANQSLGLLP